MDCLSSLVTSCVRNALSLSPTHIGPVCAFSAPPTLPLLVMGLSQPHPHFLIGHGCAMLSLSPPTYFPYWLCVCAALSQPHPHFSHYSSEFTGERIPTLYEAVDLCEELDMLMFLEMKRNAHQVDTTTVHFRLRVEGEGGELGRQGWGGMGGTVERGRGGGGRALLYNKFTKGHLFPR